MSKEQVRVGSANIFADMGYPDAEAHLLKAQIVAEIDRIMRGRKLTQKAAGEIMGISQPEVSKMLKGVFREYSVERLMGFLTLFNRDVEIVVRRREPSSGRGHVTLTTAEATA
jgi:predicted XRE-type DNA-binding protein